MPESEAESAAESAVNPYVSPEEDEADAGRLKPDVAHQVYGDIRQQAERWGLKINPDDSPIKKRLKYFVLSKVFGLFSRSTLPDYQAAQIVDLEEQTGRDPLTGLLNRRGFETQFNQSLRESIRFSQPILLLILDLDHFKKINDKYGHLVGDQALKYLARALTDSVDIGDLVGRWGGEEFIVAVKLKTGQPTNPDKMLMDLMAAERIRKKIINLLSADRYQLKSGAAEEKLPEADQITLSVGATLTTPDDDTLETVCRRADRNLYNAKEGGRNRSFGDNGRIILTSVLPQDVRPETPSS